MEYQWNTTTPIKTPQEINMTDLESVTCIKSWRNEALDSSYLGYRKKSHVFSSVHIYLMLSTTRMSPSVYFSILPSNSLAILLTCMLVVTNLSGEKRFGLVDMAEDAGV
jgi:hypothetical protein